MDHKKCIQDSTFRMNKEYWIILENQGVEEVMDKRKVHGDIERDRNRGESCEQVGSRSRGV